MSQKSTSSIPAIFLDYKKRGIGNFKHGHATRENGLSLTYKSWTSMKKRCLDQKAHNYSSYGGSGITICQKWIDSFECFLLDMGERPSSKHSVDRFPNKNGNYEPGNCRWATQKEQNNNKTNNRIISFLGVEKTVSQWADGLGISDKALRDRIKRGWPLEEALTTKLNQHPKVWPRRVVAQVNWPVQC